MNNKQKDFLLSINESYDDESIENEIIKLRDYDEVKGALLFKDTKTINDFIYHIKNIIILKCEKEESS